MIFHFGGGKKEVFVITIWEKDVRLRVMCDSSVPVKQKNPISGLNCKRTGKNGVKIHGEPNCECSFQFPVHSPDLGQDVWSWKRSWEGPWGCSEMV